jgi:ankyrin repeat protein
MNMSSLYNGFRQAVSLEVVQSIVGRRPQQSERDEFGWIHLHGAVADGASLEVLEHLVNVWPNSIGQRDHKRCIPLLFVGPESSLESVQYLVSQLPESVQVQNTAGVLPLHSSARCGASLPVLRF